MCGYTCIALGHNASPNRAQTPGWTWITTCLPASLQVFSRCLCSWPQKNELSCQYLPQSNIVGECQGSHDIICGGIQQKISEDKRPQLNTLEGKVWLSAIELTNVCWFSGLLIQSPELTWSTMHNVKTNAERFHHL